MCTFRDTQGNVPEPLWHMGIGTIKHCDDGEEMAHEWSSGYPRYTEAETQAKLDAWVLPPPGCEKISEKSGDPSICATVPAQRFGKEPAPDCQCGLREDAPARTWARAHGRYEWGGPNAGVPPTIALQTGHGLRDHGEKEGRDL